MVNPKGGDDNINLGGGNDVLLAGTGNKTITAVSGDNTINLSTGNNTVTLGTGKDTVISNTGSNTISFIADDTGNDNYTYNGGTDILEFKGDTLSQLSLDLTFGDPKIIRSSEKTVDLKNLATLTSGVTLKDKDGATSNLYNLKTIIGVPTADYAQTLVTGNGDDIIYSGLKNDTINAGTGNNTINLIITETGNENTYTYAGGTDKFVIEGIEDFSDLNLIKDGTNLIVAYGGSASSSTLTINNYYKGNGDEVDAEIKNKMTFSYEGLPAARTLADLIEEKGIIGTVVGTEGPDVFDYSASGSAVRVLGLGGNDTITGSNGGDYLVGGTGSDTIIGNGGNDTYIIDSADWGNGQDVITDNGGVDTLRINTTSDKINPFFDVVLEKEDEEYVVNKGLASYSTGNDLYIISDKDYTLDNAKTSNGVKIVNYFNDDYKIENILIPNNENWTVAIPEKVKNAIGQVVAQWLYNNGYDSVSDVIASGTDEQKAQLVKLYKPITGNGSYLYGTTGDDFIISTSTFGQHLEGKGGNDIVYAPDGGYPYLILGDGDDILFGGIPQDRGYSEYHLGNGNNTVYSKGSDYIILGEGNDEVHITAHSQVWFSGGRNEGTGFLNGGNDVVHFDTDKCAGYFRFYNTIYDDLYMTRAAENDDLVVRYGLANTVTMKDFFKAENNYLNTKFTLYSIKKYGYTNTYGLNLGTAITEKGVKNYIEGAGVIAGTEAAEYLKGSDGNDTFTSNGSDVLNGGKGDDIYNGATLTDSVAIYDSDGNDTLNVSANKDDIKVIFNIKKDGTFAKGGDKLYLANAATFDAWSTTGTLPTVGIKIEGSSSIETIKSADNYKLSEFDKLKSDVAAWLTSAKDGNGYSDVATALSSNNDVSALVAIFENASWKPVA